jgi:hypothetical protein
MNKDVSGNNNKNNNKMKNNNINNMYKNGSGSNNKHNNISNNIKKNNVLHFQCCWKTGQTNTWQTHKMFFARSTAGCKPNGAWNVYKAVMQIFLSSDGSYIYSELFE